MCGVLIPNAQDLMAKAAPERSWCKCPVGVEKLLVVLLPAKEAVVQSLRGVPDIPIGCQYFFLFWRCLFIRT